MPCPNPECKNQDDRLIVKNGKMKRKKKPGDPEVQRYVCNVCGYTSRGSSFGLPENEEEEKDREQVSKMTNLNTPAPAGGNDLDRK